MSEIRSYAYVVRPPRPSFVDDGTDEEMAIVAQHFSYLQRLLAEGVLQFAGRCDDGAFGVVLFKAPNEETATSIMEADPAVVAGVFTATLHPFRVALWGADTSGS